MYVLQINKYPEHFEKPYNNYHNYNNVEDVFYLMVHRDIIIDKPEKKAGNNKYD